MSEALHPLSGLPRGLQPSMPPGTPLMVQGPGRARLGVLFPRRCPMSSRMPSTRGRTWNSSSSSCSALPFSSRSAASLLVAAACSSASSRCSRPWYLPGKALAPRPPRPPVLGPFLPSPAPGPQPPPALPGPSPWPRPTLPGPQSSPPPRPTSGVDTLVAAETPGAPDPPASVHPAAAPAGRPAPGLGAQPCPAPVGRQGQLRASTGSTTLAPGLRVRRAAGLSLHVPICKRGKGWWSRVCSKGPGWPSCEGGWGGPYRVLTSLSP